LLTPSPPVRRATPRPSEWNHAIERDFAGESAPLEPRLLGTSPAPGLRCRLWPVAVWKDCRRPAVLLPGAPSSGFCPLTRRGPKLHRPRSFRLKGLVPVHRASAIPQAADQPRSRLDRVAVQGPVEDETARAGQGGGPRAAGKRIGNRGLRDSARWNVNDFARGRDQAKITLLVPAQLVHGPLLYPGTSPRPLNPIKRPFPTKGFMGRGRVTAGYGLVGLRLLRIVGIFGAL